MAGWFLIRAVFQTDIALSAATVPENSPEDTAIGTFSVPGFGGTVNYELTVTDDGRFKIGGVDGLVVGTTASDFEADGDTRTIRVFAQEVGGIGRSGVANFDITITDVAEPGVPVAADLQTASDTGQSTTDLITLDPTPTWDVTPVTGTFIAGDVIQVQDDAGIGFVPIINHTVSAGEAVAQLVTLTLAAQTEGDHTIRFRHTRSSVDGPWDEHDITYDYTAPILSNPVGAADTVTTADLSVATDTATGLVYFVVTANATTPTVAQAKAGTDAGNVAGQDFGSTGTPLFISVDGLDQGILYAHFVHTDVAGNDSLVVTSPSWAQGGVVLPAPLTATWESADTEPNPTFGVVPPVSDPFAVNDVINGEVYSDVGLTTLVVSFENILNATEITAEEITQGLNLANGTYYVRFRWKHENGAYSDYSNTITETIAAVLPPVLTAPTVTSTSPTAFDVQITTDTGNGNLYLVISTSPNQPTTTQMLAGQDHTGAAAFFATTLAVASTGTKTFNTAAAVFVDGTPYFAHYAQRSAALVWSLVVTSAGFGVGTADALTVVWATGPSNPDPDFDFTEPAGDKFAIGDTINGEIYDDAGLTSLIDSFEHVITAPNFAAGTATEAMSLPDATYYARFRWKHASATYSSWSATISQTIGAGAVDNIPSAFSFTDVTNATPSAEYISNLITLAGMDAGASCSVSFSGSAHTWTKDGAAYTSGATTGVNGTTFRVKTNASAADAGVVSIVMNAGGVQDTFTVTTGDATAPVVQSFTPADGNTSVALGANLIATFNEPVQFHTTVVMSLRLTSNDAVVQSFTQANIGVAIAISGSTLTINPTSDLTAGTGYYVLIDNGSIKDMSNNFFAGILVKTTWNFTTVSAGSDTIELEDLTDLIELEDSSDAIELESV